MAGGWLGYREPSRIAEFFWYRRRRQRERDIFRTVIDLLDERGCCG